MALGSCSGGLFWTGARSNPRESVIIASLSLAGRGLVCTYSTTRRRGSSEKVISRNYSTVVGDTNTDVQLFIYLLNRTNDRELRNATGEE